MYVYIYLSFYALFYLNLRFTLLYLTMLCCCVFPCCSFMDRPLYWPGYISLPFILLASSSHRSAKRRIQGRTRNRMLLVSHGVLSLSSHSALALAFLRIVCLVLYISILGAPALHIPPAVSTSDSRLKRKRLLNQHRLVWTGMQPCLLQLVYILIFLQSD